VIELGDAIDLAPGVDLVGRRLADPIRGCVIPLNDAARLVVCAATIEEAASALTSAGARDGARDALAFCGVLNTRGLLTVRIPLRARVARRARAFRYGLVLHAPVRRVEVRGPSGVARGLAVPALLLMLAIAPVGVVAGVVGLAAAAATGAGIVLHEVGHALALRGVPYALILDGLRPELLHRRLGVVRRRSVAIAGPLLPAAAAVALSLVFRPVAPVVAPLAAHALALSVLADDGRNACGLS
jgi:hypothetical protein